MPTVYETLVLHTGNTVMKRMNSDLDLVELTAQEIVDE